ncbi:MAG: DoxX family membrane protein [Terriglobia bacterium]
MGFLAESRAQVVSRRLLVVLRLYLGIAFIVAAGPKLQAGANWPERMAASLERSLPQSYGFYKAFVENTILPNQELFAFLVAWGEVLVGVGLLLGLFTRLAALMGLVMNTNYLLLLGQLPLGPMNNAALIFAEIVILLGAAGRAYGVDYFLAKRWPRGLLW